MFVTPKQTPVELNALIEPPFSGSGRETPVQEQHSVRLDPLAQFYIIARLLDQFLQGYTLTGHSTSCNGHGTEQHHDGISIHADSLFRIPTQDLIQFLKHDAFTEKPSFAGRNETPAEQNGTPFSPASWWIPGADLYQFLQRYALPASESPPSGNGYEIPAEQNDMLADAPLLLIPAESLSQFLQVYEIPAVPSLFDSGHELETPAAQQLEDGSESDPTSRSVTPTQSQDLDDLVDPQLDEATSSILHVYCPVCQCAFRRVQERNRHVESYLPHSILCPLRDCTWTGRRQWDFQEHWRKKHSEVGQAPEDADEIYDTGDFVRSIVDGTTPVDEVARSAFARIPEGLERLGRPDVEAKVLGRSRKLKRWIHIPPSQLN